MKKKISALLIAGILVITGCSFTGSNSSETDRPYDSYFKDAKEWAEFWCGPCEQIDKRKEDCDDNDYYDYIEYYTMKDYEFGFTYTVNACWKRYGSILNKPKAEYYCDDFDKPYMQEFVKATPPKAEVTTSAKVPASKKKDKPEPVYRPPTMTSEDPEKDQLLDKLWQMMLKDKVDNAMVLQAVVAEKEYYDLTVPPKDYDKDFISDVLIEAWDQVNKLCQTKIHDLPF